MGKKLVSAEQIKIGTRVFLFRNFFSLEEQTRGTVVDFEPDEFGSIKNLTIDWDNRAITPYMVDEAVSPEENIVNYLEIDN